jgi:TetR/AcrR family tetracycline transcriptional repressor
MRVARKAGKSAKDADTAVTTASGQALNPEVITAAALELIDRDGLEAFSVRNLANHLGVYPATIYWYIPNRNEVLAHVMALVLSDLLPKVRRRSWQLFLKDVFCNFREAIRQHPNVAPLIDSQVTSNANLSLDLLDGLIGALARAGLSGDTLVAAYNAVLAALVGFTAQEFAPIPADTRDAWQKHVDTRLGAISPERHPALSRHLPLLSNRSFTLRWQNGSEAPMDRSYEVYVDMIIGGIERLAETGSSQS